MELFLSLLHAISTLKFALLALPERYTYPAAFCSAIVIFGAPFARLFWNHYKAK